MNETTTKPMEPVQLAGPGYEVIIPPEAEERKADILAAAGGIVQVTTPIESELAQFEVRKLAGLRIEVEKSRKEVKAPVIALGKKIDQIAAEFLADVDQHERRLKGLIGEHAQAVLKAQRAAEAEERRKFEEARKAKEAAERAEREAAEARRKAAEAVSIKERIEAQRVAREQAAAAKAAEEAKQQANADRLEQSNQVAETKVSRGVRFVLDFEVVDIAKLHSTHPEFVTLTEKRKDVLAWLRELDHDDEQDLESIAASRGLRIFQKPVTSTR